MKQNLKPEDDPKVESLEEKWGHLSQSEQREKLFGLVQLVRYRGALRRHLADPHIFPKPVKPEMEVFDEDFGFEKIKR